MRIVLLFMSVVFLVIGFYVAFLSVNGGIASGEQLSMLAVFCVLVAIALGVWEQSLHDVFSGDDKS